MIGPVFAGIVGAVLVALLPTRDERARWRANRTATIGPKPETGTRAFPGDSATIGPPSEPTAAYVPHRLHPTIIDRINRHKENPTP